MKERPRRGQLSRSRRNRKRELLGWYASYVAHADVLALAQENLLVVVPRGRKIRTVKAKKEERKAGHSPRQRGGSSKPLATAMLEWPLFGEIGLLEAGIVALATQDDPKGGSQSITNCPRSPFLSHGSAACAIYCTAARRLTFCSGILRGDLRPRLG